MVEFLSSRTRAKSAKESEESLQLVSLDVSRTFPQLGIFQVPGWWWAYGWNMPSFPLRFVCTFHLVITGGRALPLHVEGPVGRLRLLQAGPRLRAGHVLHRRHPPSQPRGGWSFHRLCQSCEPPPTCSFLQGNTKILDNITSTLVFF